MIVYDFTKLWFLICLHIHNYFSKTGKLHAAIKLQFPEGFRQEVICVTSSRIIPK